jgi:hypothetical protein
MQSANGRTKHLPKRGRQLDADLRNAILKAGVSDNRYNCTRGGQNDAGPEPNGSLQRSIAVAKSRHHVAVSKASRTFDAKHAETKRKHCEIQSAWLLRE